MSLQSLAVVELQLTMQWLDCPSLLAMARCSRALRAAASHPFPWQHIVTDLACAGSEPPPQRPLLVRLVLNHVAWMRGVRAPARIGDGQREPDSGIPPRPSPLMMVRRFNASLLRFGGCKVSWSLTSSGTELRAQVAAVSALPRMADLSITATSDVKAERLFPEVVVLLVDGLLRHSTATLEQLNLCGNRLGDEGAVAVARLVREAPRLRTLHLSHTALVAAGWRALGEAVGQSSSLVLLTLSGMPAAGETGASAIAAALSTSTSLQRVSLSGCAIGDAGAVALANVLRRQSANSRLHALDLSRNDIGDEGTAALIDALSQCAIRSTGEPRCSPDLSKNRRCRHCQPLLSVILWRNARISAAMRRRARDLGHARNEVLIDLSAFPE